MPSAPHRGLLQPASGALRDLALRHLPVPVLRRRIARSVIPALSPGADAQLLIDVSVISQGDARTGIQRVVRNLYRQLLAAPPKGYAIRPIGATPDAAYRHFPTTFLDAPAPASGGAIVHPRPGDVFLGLDLGAHIVPRHARELARWKQHGTRMCFFVYDLLPVLQPAWFNPAATNNFRRWLRSLAVLADDVVTISRTVQDEFEAWNRREYGLAEGEIRCSVIEPGADLHRADAVGAGLPSELAGRRFALMVGTIEPRKRHEEVLDAFERLWADGESANLVIAGRQGWKVERFIERLRAHPERGHRLHWLEGPGDDVLIELYRHASGVIMASQGEGFGLPLIEAAYFNVPVLARDIPIFREVARTDATFFPDGAPSRLGDALGAWIRARDAVVRVAPSSSNGVTWSEGRAQLVSALFTGTGTRAPDGVIDAGLDQWVEMPTGGPCEWAVRCPYQACGPRYLGLDFGTGEPIEAAVAVNATHIAAFTLERSRARVKAVRFVCDGRENADTLRIKVHAGGGESQLQRFGIFASPPREALRCAMAAHVQRAPDLASGPVHQAFTGSVPGVEIGACVDLGGARSAPPALAGGWHGSDADGTWTDGTPASVYVRPRGALGNLLRITVEWEGYVWARKAGASFRVAIGAAPAIDLLQPRQEIALATSEALDAQGRLLLTFLASGAIAPHDVGDSEDARPLALKVHRIAFASPLEFVDLFRDVPVRLDDRLARPEAFTGGWHGTEPDGRWSSGKPSTIALRLPEVPAAPVRLALQLSAPPGLAPGETARIRVAAGADPDAVLELKGEAIETHVVTLAPGQLPRNSRELVIALACDSSVRLSERLESADDRELSFKLHSLLLLGAAPPGGGDREAAPQPAVESA